MNLFAVALQGTGGGPLSVALQGFYDEPGAQTDQGMAGYVSRINRERKHTTRLALDDQAATDFIMALVFSEILYGTVQH